MDEVVDIERDFRRAKQGENLIYTTLLGLKPDLTTPRTVPEILENTGLVNDENKEGESNSDDEDLDEGSESGTETEDSDSNSEDENNDRDGDENNNKSENSSIYYRPRDESPNSRKVFIVSDAFIIL